MPVDEKGLTIGGFELAGFSDFVAAYILEMTSNLFLSSAYNGIYRDDGINILRGKWTTAQLVQWRDNFQSEVNLLTESEYLQFTLEIWRPNAPESEPNSDKVTIHDKESFPYLDMELYWHHTGDLKCRVHLKKNQTLKYLNNSSNHRECTFRAIPKSVVNRLAQLTSLTPENENETIDKLYPSHHKALKKAKLNPKEYPTLKDAQEAIRIQSEIKANSKVNPDDTPDIVQRKTRAARKKERDKRRRTWFCIGQSNIWDEPISWIIKKLVKKYNLTWLRCEVSYHRFSNLTQMFHGDLTDKLMEGIVDLEGQTLPCNCNKQTKSEDGSCIYNGLCRTQMVIYDLKCKLTEKATLERHKDT